MTARDVARHVGGVFSVAIVMLGIDARADDPQRAPSASASAAPSDVAVARYREGARLLQEGRHAEALAELDASLAALPSANTELLRAHALRLLGRRVEALEAYASVERAAGARVRAGEDKYRPTLEDSGRWLALLRTELGELAVTVRRAGPGASIAIDGRPAPATVDPTGTLRARVWREPGRATVTIVPASTVPAKQMVADVDAGSVRSIDVEGTPEPTPEPDEEPSSAPPAAAWVAWGVGAVGIATFAIFGSMARSAADELDACRPSCRQSLKDRADGGERDETIANVGLVFGALGVVGGGVAWIVSTQVFARPSASPRRALHSRLIASAPGPQDRSARRPLLLVCPTHGGVGAGIRSTF